MVLYPFNVNLRFFTTIVKFFVFIPNILCFKVPRNRYDIVEHEYTEGIISVLWMSDARKRKDALTFTCLATNRINQTSKNIEVILLDGKCVIWSVNTEGRIIKVNLSWNLTLAKFCQLIANLFLILLQFKLKKLKLKVRKCDFQHKIWTQIILLIINLQNFARVRLPLKFAL